MVTFRVQTGQWVFVRAWVFIRDFTVSAKSTKLSETRNHKLNVLLSTSRMRWIGHVERSTGWIAEVHKLNVVVQKGPGRPRKTRDGQKEARCAFC